MSNEVTVQVTITERVRYSAFVKMPREKFEELATALEEKRGAELRRLEEKIGEYCDRQSDWQDADNVEIECFDIVKDEDAERLNSPACAASCAGPVE